MRWRVLVCGLTAVVVSVTACSTSDDTPDRITRIDGPAVVDENKDGIPDG